MRILAIGDTRTGCYWVRIKNPLTQLQKHGHTVFLADANQAVTPEGWDIVVFNNLLGGVEVIEGKETEDSSLRELVKDFKAHGAKIVYDSDDAQDIMPDYIKNKDVYDACISSFPFFLKEADLITVTTENLASHVRKYTDKPVKVLPNCINPEEFPQRKILDKVKIGFAGSPSHIKDIELVIPAIKKLKEKYDIYFEIFGLKVDGFKCKNPVRRYEYAQTLAEMGIDIGICPLKDTEFNKYKSPLKFLEYGSVGTAVLASKRAPYIGEMKDEWLVEDDKWYERLEELILNKEKREQIQKEQSEWILKNRDINKEYTRWEKEYQKLVNSPTGF